MYGILYVYVYNMQEDGLVSIGKGSLKCAVQSFHPSFND